ncbi:hypothetical protein ACHAWF_012897 [Thalassiosira exigua]
MSSERRRVARAFKSRGLSVQSSALDACLNVLARERSSAAAYNDALCAIVDEVKERMVHGGKRGGRSGGGGGGGGVVTPRLLEEVVAQLSRTDADVTEEAVQLLDAFRTPRLVYDPMRRRFELMREGRGGGGSLYGEAGDKVEMYAQRYELVRQRVLRQDVFQPKLAAGRGRDAGREGGGETSHALTPVESLLGRGGTRYLLGMIVQVEEGRYYLEDHTGQVPLDLSSATLLTDGFVTEGGIVLVEGEAIDGMLHVRHVVVLVGTDLYERGSDLAASLVLRRVRRVQARAIKSYRQARTLRRERDRSSIDIAASSPQQPMFVTLELGELNINEGLGTKEREHCRSSSHVSSARGARSVRCKAVAREATWGVTTAIQARWLTLSSFVNTCARTGIVCARSPIVENRADAIQAIGVQNSDIFDSIGSISELEKLREQEARHGDGMFVVLSDVHLDSPAVLDRIERMLAGYADFAPLPVFVFMGNFSSRPLVDGAKAMTGCFEDLANVVSKFPNVADEGRFVFVPGPNDPGISGVLPRGPIPKCFTSALRSRVKHVVFASNPCRMRFFSKEIVFFRDDLVGKMRRHCLLEPREDESDEDFEGDNGNEGGKAIMIGGRQRLPRHVVKTVLDQGHLSPLPLSTSPVFWRHDHALRLYPFPDALIVGDQVDPYYENYEECDAINPGPFSNGYKFVAYHPVGEVQKATSTSDVDFCEIE